MEVRRVVCRTVGALTVGRREISHRKQGLMYPNSARELGATAKQTAQSKVQLGWFGIKLGHFDERIKGSVGLFVQQEIQALEIGVGQGTRFGKHLPKVDPRRNPSKRA